VDQDWGRARKADRPNEYIIPFPKKTAQLICRRESVAGRLPYGSMLSLFIREHFLPNRARRLSPSNLTGQSTGDDGRPSGSHGWAAKREEERLEEPCLLVE
jgi:hypothetical protein